jgi:hypothetical protein
VNPAGTQVKVELMSQWGDAFDVEITHDEYKALSIRNGNEVYVKPKETKAFVEDYVI